MFSPPGQAPTALSVVNLTARLAYKDLVLREVPVGPDGQAAFDSVDFNKQPGNYTLQLQLTPTAASALAAEVNHIHVEYCAV